MGRGLGALIGACLGAALLLGCSAGDAGASGRKPGASAGAGGTFGNSGIAGGAITGGTGAAGEDMPTGIGQVVAPGEGAECAGVTEEAFSGPAPVDIIWALDNSGSMTFEAMEVQTNMNTFATSITAAGIDVHVVIISDIGPPGFIMDPSAPMPPFPFPFPFPLPTGVSNGVCIGTPLGSGTCPDDTKLPGYLHVPAEVASSDALFQLIMHYPTYKPVLRPKSLKYFAVVTDDESSMLSDQFMQMVSTLEPGWFDSWKFFGVFCHPNECTMGFPEAPCVTPGVVYQELVDRTGGIAGSLCQGQSDFKSVFDALAQTVVQNIELACEWAIPPVPMGEIFAKNKVNVRYTPGGGTPEDIYWVDTPAMCGDKGGWYYDDNTAPTKLQACAATCERVKHDMAGKVEVRFGCLTIVRPD